jgi:hypothetical protein
MADSWLSLARRDEAMDKSAGELGHGLARSGPQHRSPARPPRPALAGFRFAVEHSQPKLQGLHTRTGLKSLSTNTPVTKSRSLSVPRSGCSSAGAQACLAHPNHDPVRKPDLDRTLTAPRRSRTVPLPRARLRSRPAQTHRRRHHSQSLPQAAPAAR